MNNNPIFAHKLLLAFIGLAIGAFVLSLYLMGKEDPAEARHGANSFSSSAIGYAGIAEVLQKFGMRVVKSRRNPAEQAEGGVLIVAEPRMELLPTLIVPILPEAETTLLILPKWGGESKGEKTNWISRAFPITTAQIQRVLGLAVDRPQIERRDLVTNWSVNEIGVAPHRSERLQLIKSDKLKPLVAAGDGILLGELEKDGRTIWVLSDPDLIANHGLNEDGKGAEFAVALIKRLADGGKLVVFDETVHGFQARPDAALNLLFQFPYSIITLQVVIAAALLLWATMGRFGPPEIPPPPLGAGKAGLISNVADLMEFAGHERMIIQRYVESTIRDTARQLRAPKNLSYEQTLEWLSRIGKARNITRDCASIARLATGLANGRGHIDIAKFADAARQIHQWKQEILDGPSIHTRHH
jgi:hypothetical protein